jgi:Permeases of the drug/metabolite transporter (DMT) superfamily
MLPTVPALTMAFWRMLLASSMLWLYSLITKQKPLSKGSRSRVAFAGVFLGFHFACFFWGVRNTTIANATLLANTGPLFTIGLTYLLYKKVSKKVFFPLTVAILGIFIIQVGELSFSSITFLGNFVSLFSGFCIAVVYIIARQVRKENSTVSYGKAVFFFASTTIALVCLIMDVSLFDFEREHIPWFLFLGFVPSILGHNSLNYAIRFLSPTAVASIPLGEPLIASLLGLVLLSQAIPLAYIQGAPFVLIGVYFIIKNSENKH